MMAVTVLTHSVVTEPATAAKLKQIVRKTALQVRVALTVNLISQLTDLNAVIPHGMSLVLTA